MSGDYRAYELLGESRHALLDWLHVHADLAGVLEEATRTVVWSVHALPTPPHAAWQWQELPVSPADLAITGLEHDAPILVAPDLLVRPPWVERPAGFAGLELVVPRGAAFGSGEHDSTQAALVLLHRTWAQPASVVDVGTGSGILLLYAAARGCQDLQGCDIDAPSVAAARELLPLARMVLGGPELLSAADCVIANMTGSELTACMPAILQRWNRRGLLLLSGMREHEVAPVLALVGVAPRERLTRGQFTACVFAASC